MRKYIPVAQRQAKQEQELRRQRASSGEITPPPYARGYRWPAQKRTAEQ